MHVLGSNRKGRAGSEKTFFSILRTPLYWAAQNGNVECLQFLHELGADVNQATNDGASPVYAAAGHGTIEITRLLQTLGADVNKCSNDGTSPVFAAAWNVQQD